MSRTNAKYELIARAIKEAGTTETGPVMLKLEDILDAEMLARQAYYKKATSATRMGALMGRLERMGIYTYNDVAALIEEVMVKRAKPGELRRALGM